MAGKDVDWETIRAGYEDTENAIEDVAAQAGMSGAQLAAHAKKNGWALRSKPRPAAKAAAAKKPGELVKRVYATIDGELNKLEQQRGLTSQDRERASRALSQMVNSLEKAIDMQREMTKRQAKGSAKKDKEALAHAEDIRREIAERLDRLSRARVAAKRSS